MDGDYFMRKGYAHLYDQHFDLAREAFLQAIACNPTNPDYYFHASVTLHRNGQLQEALTLAERAATLCPENDLYRQHREEVIASLLVEDAKHWLSKRRYEEALRCYAEAKMWDPLNEQASLGSEHLQSYGEEGI
ncbi:MAG: tetratricopeptide repeat protein [Alicyclobacillaceae bacterium]|jgi:tetratricopeptide (TPR) repeat protein|uniref:tetratricopeptide repeat protein n=1 Tax=Alicyclobacillus sp. SP_1 TaxID=2942475 RepID=UPI002157E583|nr:tetratricopeptide repeat protein [Alicyclobacillus sp. SP_1]MCY0888194.1 tetratricopeptide repeat protein [Alicyclobacillaceae bacterium]MCY0896450.1 tetratricopeptide repeat protein [Alicyclobacillaceae bacterium]